MPLKVLPSQLDLTILDAWYLERLGDRGVTLGVGNRWQSQLGLSLLGGVQVLGLGAQVHHCFDPKHFLQRSSVGGRGIV
jgi:hypothetical protein